MVDGGPEPRMDIYRYYYKSNKKDRCISVLKKKNIWGVLMVNHCHGLTCEALMEMSSGGVGAGMYLRW